MIKSESVVNLTKALIKAKRLFAPLLRNKENPGFKRGNETSKYADLAAVIEATETPLLDNGLVISQLPHNDGDRIGVQTVLLHESGEFLEHTFTLPIAVQNAQTGVGAVTYARRVSMKAVLGVSDEDDDGNTAAGMTTKTAATTTARPTNPPQKTQPPKAEIPSTAPATAAATSTSEQPTASAPVADAAVSSDVLPTEAELKGLRVIYGQLGDALATGGLKANKGLPIGKKVLAYLLKTTGAPAAEKITKAQWNTFFTIVNAVKSSDGGIKELVRLVNEANGITEEKKS